MFDIDLLLAFAFMAILFLRQVSILKEANKINYAPLMIAIGTISSLIHFILHPDTSNAVLLIRESLLPMLVSLFLYMIMNILHQTKESENAKLHDKFTKTLVNELSQLKEFILELENRMVSAQQAERTCQEEIRSQFKDDIKALDTIQLNQNHFLDKFDNMESLHQGVSKGLEYFTNVQLPELDNVVHKHIDILRVAEQDHYNKLNTLLEKFIQSRGDISGDIEQLKENIGGIKKVSDNIAHIIVTKTLNQLSGVTKSFESQMLSLKSHTESVKTSLVEGETTLYNIRKQSEMIMKQMVLSANKMGELEQQNGKLHDVYTSISDIMSDIERIKSDYVKAQSQLSQISNELAQSKDEQVKEMKLKIDDLSKSFSNKIDESLEKLHEHYHISNDEINQNLQRLSQRAKFQKGYTELDT